jgi:8-hydroxy-5-deazaflavin:NADPH oxidoreductase
MKIAIIGAGNVGLALAQGWLKAGHVITLGSRSPESAESREKAAALGAAVTTASHREAAAGADVVVLSTPWPATEETLAASGDLTGKILIDCTNPLAPRLAGLTHGLTNSGAEQVAAWAPGARVVKGFNTMGANIMADTQFPNGSPVMLAASDDAEAKAVACQLAEQIGFEAVDAGPLRHARYLEPMAMQWIQMAMVLGQGRDFAFGIVRR